MSRREWQTENVRVCTQWVIGQVGVTRCRDRQHEECQGHQIEGEQPACQAQVAGSSVLNNGDVELSRQTDSCTTGENNLGDKAALS